MNGSARYRLRTYEQLDEDGYTLIELVVALLVALVLSSVLFAVHLATTQWVVPWQREVELENHMHIMAQRLVADLAQAEQLISDGSAWTLTYRSGRAVAYRYEEGALLRNELPMHAEGLRVVEFRLDPSRAEMRYALPRREAAFENERSVLQVEIHLSIRSRERTLTVVTSTALRQHRPWLPLY